MAIITISRGSLAGGRELATRLADELGCACLSREDLTAKAAELGVPVDKLQSSMAKPPSAYHGLRWDRDQYLACMTMLLCERILKEDLVYYGHAAHLLLCGVPNILRIRVLAESRFRIDSVVRTMGLSREQAKQHIAQVDAGREKWVRFLYGVDWNDPTNYDMVVHLDQMGLNNAVAATLAVARQSDFEMTPAAKKAVKNLYVAGKAHLVLSTDPKTSFAHVRVSANDGRVQVICPPQYSEVVPHIKDVLSSLPEVINVSATIAENTIMFLQDEFSEEMTGFANLVRRAKKWNAAVDLVRFSPRATVDDPEIEALDVASDPEQTRGAGIVPRSERDGGRRGGVEAEASLDRCLDVLRKEGCLGGTSTFCGNENALLGRIRRTHYSMVVVGNVFTNRSEAVRIRRREELTMFLADKAGVPVLESSELGTHRRFGAGKLLQMAGALALAALIFGALFTHQADVIDFLSGGKPGQLRVLAVLVVLAVSSLFAYAYGTLASQILKFFRFD